MDGHRADTITIPDGPPDSKKKPKADQRITVGVVTALAPPATGNRVVWDKDLTGFGVRITAAGAVSFVLRYVVAGRERRFTLGKHPDLSPSAARDHATVLRGKIVAGEDPMEARHEARKAPTVDDLCDDYLERHARPKKRSSSVEGDESLIRLYIRPKLGARKVASVTSRDLDELHQSLQDRPYQANRLIALVSKMFSLAVKWGWRPDNPCRGIERFAESERDEWLKAEQLGALANTLKAYPDKRAVAALLLLVLTGARRGEVLKATWDQFDLGRGVWTKPSHHTKQKKIEHIPLNRDALRLVSNVRRGVLKAIGSEAKLEDFPFLFPGDADGKPLQNLKRPWKEICGLAGLNGIRVHDLRHTYASHLVSGGLSLPLVGKLIGHTQAKTTQRYAHLADDPLRKATAKFGAIFKLASVKRTRPKAPNAKVLLFRKKAG